jgi:hypothetical protein
MPLRSDPIGSAEEPGREFGASDPGGHNYLTGCPFDPAPAAPNSRSELTAAEAPVGMTAHGSAPQAKPELPTGREGQGDGRQEADRGWHVDADLAEIRRQSGHGELDEPTTTTAPMPSMVGRTHGGDAVPVNVVRGQTDAERAPRAVWAQKKGSFDRFA